MTQLQQLRRPWRTSWRPPFDPGRMRRAPVRHVRIVRAKAANVKLFSVACYPYLCYQSRYEQIQASHYRSPQAPPGRCARQACHVLAHVVRPRASRPGETRSRRAERIALVVSGDSARCPVGPVGARCQRGRPITRAKLQLFTYVTLFVCRKKALGPMTQGQTHAAARLSRAG